VVLYFDDPNQSIEPHVRASAEVPTLTDEQIVSLEEFRRFSSFLPSEDSSENSDNRPLLDATAAPIAASPKDTAPSVSATAPRPQAQNPLKKVDIGLPSLEGQISALITSQSDAEEAFPEAYIQAILIKALDLSKENEARIPRSVTKEEVDEISKEFEERLRNLEEERLIHKDEMIQLRRKIVQVSDDATKKNLEERVTELEKTNGLLMAEYMKHEMILKEQQSIMGTPSYSRFYLSLRSKLEQIFLGCKVVAGGVAAPDTFTVAQKLLGFVQLVGSNIPLPAANFFATGALVLNTGFGSVQGNKVDRNASLVVGSKEMDEVIETVARRLALTFGEQLDCITPESAWRLGECASQEIVAYLWTSNVEEKHGDELVELLISVVVKIEPEDSSKATKVTEKAKGLARSAWDTINQPFNFNTDISTNNPNDGWTSDGIFHRTGILVVREGTDLGFLYFFTC